jgi:hypothetical protein
LTPLLRQIGWKVIHAAMHLEKLVSFAPLVSVNQKSLSNPPFICPAGKNPSISMPNPNLVYHVSNLFFYYATCVEIHQPAKINISQGAY